MVFDCNDWHEVFREGQSKSPWVLLGEPTLLSSNSMAVSVCMSVEGMYLVPPQSTDCGVPLPYVLEQQLMEASGDGNIDVVKKLLEQGVDVDCTDVVSTISSITYCLHDVYVQM